MSYTTQWVHLGPDEWGSDLMAAIALDAFARYEGDRDRLLVEVHEHGGWALGFAMIDGKMRIVSSANDRARFPDSVKEWWRDYNKGPHRCLPTIRRGEQAVT